jgi:hypothetical protein
MTPEHDPPKRPSKPRTEAQKLRRKERWLSRAHDRRAREAHALTRRYEELKASMSKIGVRIGTVADLPQRIEDPLRRFEVLKARVERWEALWAITLRKRMTRGKIVIGGAVLAELGELVMEDPTDQAFLAMVVDLLDRRVPRVQDRVILRALLAGPGGGGAALPLRPGGPLDEPVDAALAALGEAPSVLGGGRSDDGEDELQADEDAEADDREGGVECL